MSDHPTSSAGPQSAAAVSRRLAQGLEFFIAPLLLQLDNHLDKRLVRTFFATLIAIIQFRHRNNALLLSELGAFILDPQHAPAGTKRLSNLLRSSKWCSSIISDFLFANAAHHLALLEQEQIPALLIWDGSVLEKPESSAAEGLCAVRSSKAARLKRIRPGFYRPPPGPPVFVPGLRWHSLLLCGVRGAPQLAAMRWWSSRGVFATDQRQVEAELLLQWARRWRQRVVHVFDQGFAGEPWLNQLLNCYVRFVLRWRKEYHLLGPCNEDLAAWQLSRGKRSWGEYELWDGRRQCWRKVGVLAVPVRHISRPGRQLWLVVSRPGKGLKPWYLLTNEAVTNADEAWAVVLAYARRWQIEQEWRYCKSELGFESPRLWKWENREKILLMASLVYSYLLSLLDLDYEGTRQWLLRHWCHRTGQRSRQVAAPLYRLRAALSRLWLAYPPPPLFIPQTPG